MGNQLKKCGGKMEAYNKDLDAMKSNMEKAKKGIDAADSLSKSYEKGGIMGAVENLDK